MHRFTAADIAALRARKSELSNQLNSAVSRRREVQRSLRGAVGADKAGLEQRLGVLDTRIARLEQDIDENSSQLASLDAARQTGTGIGLPYWGLRTGNRIQENTMPLAMMFVMFVMSPIAIGVSRFYWKRGTRAAAAQGYPDPTARLERMEQAIESIAIEIERVSEGQRFVTRLMSDGRASALRGGEPAMEPVRVGGDSAAEQR
ncbi:MAG: hypothetical protein JWN79_2713 [Gemmatimonadetes bacterium]|nr:hypothetical protein [Gemmatimonadota bacterium]